MMMMMNFQVGFCFPAVVVFLLLLTRGWRRSHRNRSSDLFIIVSARIWISGSLFSSSSSQLELSSKGEYEHPESKAVLSFMDLLDKSNMSTAVRDSVYLLVMAMEGTSMEL